MPQRRLGLSASSALVAKCGRLFDPNNRLFDASEPCFEAIDAGFAHEPSTEQPFHKGDGGTKQRAVSGHCADDE
jgi:hypothetical protein